MEGSTPPDPSTDPRAELVLTLLEHHQQLSLDDLAAHLEVLTEEAERDPQLRLAVRARATQTPTRALLNLTARQHLVLLGPDMLATLAPLGLDPDLAGLVVSEALLNPGATLASALETVSDEPEPFEEEDFESFEASAPDAGHA